MAIRLSLEDADAVKSLVTLPIRMGEMDLLRGSYGTASRLLLPGIDTLEGGCASKEVSMLKVERAV